MTGNRKASKALLKQVLRADGYDDSQIELIAAIWARSDLGLVDVLTLEWSDLRLEGQVLRVKARC